MATNKELEQRVAQLERALAMATGNVPRSGRVPEAERRDYIEFGSEKHLAFLGLEKVDDVAAAEKNRYVVYTSPDTDQVYRLLDEMGAAAMLRPMDPDKAILMVLRQKVSSFESGPPKPFPGAPPRFNPEGEPEFTPLN
jgi:hypothetical protein